MIEAIGGMVVGHVFDLVPKHSSTRHAWKQKQK
jgi:hypothetical protein